MLSQFKKIMEELEIFVVGNPLHLGFISSDILGYKIKNEFLFDGTSTSSSYFVERIHKLDSLAFGGQGMGMEKWMVYDCAILPSAIVGFGIKEEMATKEILSLFGIKKVNQAHLIPLSMFMCIPAIKKDHWVAHNLSSLSRVINNYKGLGILTKIAGLLALNARHVMGATQWTSPALRLHSELSTMYLLSSFTPLHSKENTLTYYSHYSEEDFARVLKGEKRGIDTDLLVESKDLKLQKELQQKIEKGETFSLNGYFLESDKINYSLLKIS